MYHRIVLNNNNNTRTGSLSISTTTIRLILMLQLQLLLLLMIWNNNVYFVTVIAFGLVLPITVQQQQCYESIPTTSSTFATSTSTTTRVQQQQQHNLFGTRPVPNVPSSTTSRRSSSRSSSSSSNENEHMMIQSSDSNVKVKNIFYNYNGPIVLIGCSSIDNEMTRLAAFLSTQLSNPSISNNNIDNPQQESSSSSSSSSTSVSKVVPITSTTDIESLIEAIRDHKYQWPDVLILDMSIIGTSTVAQTTMINIAKTFYEELQLLSIYINIDSNTILENGIKTTIEESIFIKYTDYEICILDEGEGYNPDFHSEMIQDWEHIEWELLRILARARLISPLPGDVNNVRYTNSAQLTMGQHTFFLSLSFPDIQQMEPYAETLCKDIDVMEYRTDLLNYRNERFDVIYGMQLLRKYCRRHVQRVPAVSSLGSIILEDNMPIVYTVRTQNQAGTYPDDPQSIQYMFQHMLLWGLRNGVEVLDIETAWDPILISNLLNVAEERYASQILGSHHVVGKTTTIEDAVELFVQCGLNGRAHGAKVVLSIDTEEQDRMAYEAALIATEVAISNGDPVIPHISLILGDIGQFSRIINIPFTPVTHEVLPFKAAPGQLTSNEIMTTRLLTKIFTPMKYAILGHNIAYSVSPQMHGAAFAATQLPHDYIRVDVATVEEFIESDFFKSDNFGGTSVTVPHKQAIIPYVDVLSDAAEAIGSVNTLIAKVEFIDDDFKRIIYGDNTDWRGIYNPLHRLLANTVNPMTDYALIIGAGGTARAAAYVAKQLQLKIIYYNRTPSKAQELQTTFGGTVLTSLSKTNDDSDGISLQDFLDTNPSYNIKVIISTVPAASEFVLPTWFYENHFTNYKPIIFDVNYKPYSTKLLNQAEQFGCPLVRGSEMLWEQGVGQFELWTGRTAPYNVMKQIVLQNCLQDVSTAVVAPPETVTTTTTTTNNASNGEFE